MTSHVDLARSLAKQLSTALDNLEPPFPFAPFALANNLHDEALRLCDALEKAEAQRDVLVEALQHIADFTAGKQTRDVAFKALASTGLAEGREHE